MSADDDDADADSMATVVIGLRRLPACKLSYHQHISLGYDMYLVS